MVVARRDFVEDPACGREDAAVPRPAEPEREVDVLVVGAERGIEGAHGSQRLGPVEGTRPAGAEDRVGRMLEPTLRGLTMTALARPTDQRVRIAGRIHSRWVGSDEDQGGDRSDQRVNERSQAGLDPAGRDFGVVIEELNVKTASFRDPSVSGAQKPPLRSRRNNRTSGCVWASHSAVSSLDASSATMTSIAGWPRRWRAMLARQISSRSSAVIAGDDDRADRAGGRRGRAH